ncbi:MFS transporter [Deinococcus multiflagellatus]|uniref:MFS transporter n=1 Tax=Deinococcus multiflagellatus TaxID=1656887 RepID=A0ABW1ZUL8_9DEIO|nr:MFS transporter [Deinococcus multiflagellatus]MBZ9715026.1 MFS transporter [Deinococcus multiflagellatus]
MMLPTPSGTPKVSPKATLFFTIFTAMLGLSVLFPVIAPLARQLGLSESQAGWFSAVYSLMQLVFAPFWGQQSERWGRKPVLLLGLVGFALSFGLFGLVAQLGLRGVLGGGLVFALLLACRLLGGLLSSATLPTAQAMMADLTPREARASAMGLIGAAFGLGVVFGPALGGLLSGVGLVAPVFFSAGLGLLTAVVGFFTLPETLRRDQASPQGQTGRAVLQAAPVRMLLLLGALSTLASVAMEQTIGFYVQDTLHLSTTATARTVGSMLALFGIVAALVQGGAMRRLGRAIPPAHLLALGLGTMGAGMGALSLAASAWTMALALAVIGVGSALLSPTLSAALSLSVGERQQGAVAGFNASALALGRMAGPLLGTALYQRVGHAAPYWVSGSLLAALLAWVWMIRPQIRAVAAPQV